MKFIRPSSKWVMITIHKAIENDLETRVSSIKVIKRNCWSCWFPARISVPNTLILIFHRLGLLNHHHLNKLLPGIAWLFQLEITCLIPMSATLDVNHDTQNLFMSSSIFIRSSFTIAFRACLIG